MIEQIKGEPRIEYLARVLHELMDSTIAGEQTIDYDETTCDGLCLAHDIIAELGLDTLDTGESDDIPGFEGTIDSLNKLGG